MEKEATSKAFARYLIKILEQFFRKNTMLSTFKPTVANRSGIFKLGKLNMIMFIKLNLIDL